LSVAVLDISDDTAHNSANRFPRNRGLSRTAKGKGQHVEDEDDDGTNKGLNKHFHKEHQPNWDYEEVMELIHAKEREYEKLKLNQDARDNMESAVTRWKKISEEIAKAGVSTYFRGGTACQDKWGSLFTGYKKIADYSSGTGNNSSYFKMISKQRKEAHLPPKFPEAYFNAMHKYLKQRPCLNPSHQRDSLGEEDHPYMIPKHLHQFCEENDIDPTTLSHADDFQDDPVLRHNLHSPNAGGSEGHLPRRPESQQGKEKES
jgi:hypothetical protein